MSRYIPNTEEDRARMMAVIGISGIDALFADIPEDLKLKKPLDLPESMPEQELEAHMRRLAGMNTHSGNSICFLGAGAYDHFVPSIVRHIVSKTEFYTSYTPYQPEISQGMLQAIFEYQTMICRLTGMDVSNASMYDGAAAVAEAALMAARATGRSGIAVSAGLHPEYREVLKTYAKFNGIDITEVGLDGLRTDKNKLMDSVSGRAAVIMQSPNFFGVIEDIGRAAAIAEKNGALSIACVDPVSLAILEPPRLVAEAMRAADVVFCPTSKSLSHTQARRRACEAGARIATLPNIRFETFLRALAADYPAIARRSERVADILTGRERVHLTTPAGTDLVFSLEGRTAKPDTGICHERGDFSNLPAGEAFIAPVEGTANGVVVVDGTMFETRLTDDPLRLTFRDGLVVGIEGHAAVAERLKGLIDRLGPAAGNLAELGVGTNEKAQLCGSTLEDEKVLGTVHLACGDNSTFGGKTQVSSHQDGILLKPTLVVDGLTVMENGKLLVEEE